MTDDTKLSPLDGKGGNAVRCTDILDGTDQLHIIHNTARTSQSLRHRYDENNHIISRAARYSTQDDS